MKEVIAKVSNATQHVLTGTQIVRCKDCVHMRVDNYTEVCACVEGGEFETIGEGFCWRGVRDELRSE